MIGALGGAVKEDVMNTFDAWNPASVACENQSMNHSGAQPSTRRVVCGGNHIRYVARPGELQCATVQAKNGRCATASQEYARKLSPTPWVQRSSLQVA